MFLSLHLPEQLCIMKTAGVFAAGPDCVWFCLSWSQRHLHCCHFYAAQLECTKLQQHQLQRTDLWIDCSRLSHLYRNCSNRCWRSNVFSFPRLFTLCCWDMLFAFLSWSHISLLHLIVLCSIMLHNLVSRAFITSLYIICSCLPSSSHSNQAIQHSIVPSTSLLHFCISTASFLCSYISYISSYISYIVCSSTHNILLASLFFYLCVCFINDHNRHLELNTVQQEQKKVLH